MMRGTYFFYICAIVFCSCGQKTPDTAQSTQKTNTPQSTLGATGTKSLMNMLDDYYHLKDALVAENTAMTDSSAQKLALSADNFKTAWKKNGADQKMLPAIDSITQQSIMIATIQDPKLEKQRASFSRISDLIYGVLKKVDLKNASVYYDHCPMAFDEKGANWLSSYAEIKNPYLSKKMLDCGEITDSL